MSEILKSVDRGELFVCQNYSPDSELLFTLENVPMLGNMPLLSLTPWQVAILKERFSDKITTLERLSFYGDKPQHSASDGRMAQPGSVSGS